MSPSDRTGAFRDMAPCFVRSVKETEHQSEKLVDIRERIGSWRTSIRFNQVTEERFEEDHEIGVYTYLRNKLINQHAQPPLPPLYPGLPKKTTAELLGAEVMSRYE